MIIGEDSSLRYLPGGLKAEQKLFLDGVRYSIDIADLAYDRLRQILPLLTDRGLEEGSKDVELSSLIAAALLDAWAIADAANRLRVLLPGLARLKLGIDKRSPALAAFDKHTQGRVKGLETLAQSLDRERRRLFGYRSSAWGVLGWVAMPDDGKPGYMCFIVPGTICPKRIPMINPLLKSGLKPPVDLITLAIGREFLCLTEALRAMEKTAAQLDTALAARFGTVRNARRDVLARTEIEFGPDKIKQGRFWFLRLEKEDLDELADLERQR
jgi:hypothetical protein